ncbi:MAG: flagellar basal body L-ring protein FlgH [bacterium]
MNDVSRELKWCLIGAILLITIGCKHRVAYIKDQPAPVLTSEVIRKELPQPKKGSLWSNSPDGQLFSDRIAKRVGDIITVNIIETAQASGNVKNKTKRSSSYTAGITSLFGAKKMDEKTSLGAEMDKDFDGGGSISRSGKITATITATVTDVLPNNNLVIKGQRMVTINKERQLITLSGVIRPEDISSNNSIRSTYIADADISYNGKGSLSSKQEPGWFGRIVDILWPF